MFFISYCVYGIGLPITICISTICVTESQLFFIPYCVYVIGLTTTCVTEGNVLTNPIYIYIYIVLHLHRFGKMSASNRHSSQEDYGQSSPRPHSARDGSENSQSTRYSKRSPSLQYDPVRSRYRSVSPRDSRLRSPSGYKRRPKDHETAPSTSRYRSVSPRISRLNKSSGHNRRPKDSTPSKRSKRSQSASRSPIPLMKLKKVKKAKKPKKSHKRKRSFFIRVGKTSSPLSHQIVGQLSG